MAPRTDLPSPYPVVKVNNYYRSLDPTSRDKDHRGPLEQGFIDNRLHDTDVSEFIHARYDPLVKFLQDGT